jgi:hypothetical protein
MPKNIRICFAFLCFVLVSCYPSDYQEIVDQLNKNSTEIPLLKTTINSFIEENSMPTEIPPHLAKVIVNNSSIRDNPSNEGQVLEKLLVGEYIKVFALDESGKWFQIESLLGTKGWINLQQIFYTWDIESIYQNKPTTKPKQSNPTNGPSHLVLPTSIIVRLTSTPRKSFDESYYLNLLKKSYEDYFSIYDKLNLSPGTGEDVKEAYLASREIIDKLNQIYIPYLSIASLKSKLIDGIDKQSTGFGCYSNETLCSGDLEATQLLLQGRIALDQFISDYNNF